MHDRQLADLPVVEGAALALVLRGLALKPHVVIGDQLTASLYGLQQRHGTVRANQRRRRVNPDHREAAAGRSDRVACACMRLLLDPQRIELGLERRPLRDGRNRCVIDVGALLPEILAAHGHFPSLGCVIGGEPYFIFIDPDLSVPMACVFCMPMPVFLSCMPIARIACVARALPGCVRPGTLDGAAATQIPTSTNATANIVESRSPYGSTFSAKIVAATTSIHVMLITPRANRISISPQQHPMQKAPCSKPIRTAPDHPRRQPLRT